MRSQRFGVLGLCGLLLMTGWPAIGQVIGTVHKPPVAPTNGKPAESAAGPSKITVRVLTFRLKHDRRLNGSRIRVTAYRNRVGLYGTVPNYHQRRIAEQVAQSIIGITYVADHLHIAAQPLPSPQLRARVRKALRENPATARQNIRVQAYRGMVGLKGTVSTLSAKQTAIRLAKRIMRVSVVQDNLQVHSGPKGASLVSAVKSALHADRSLRSGRFRVLSNKGGYIYLRGTVYSRSAKRRAETDASRVRGVTGLTNAIVVLRPGLKRYRRPTH
jgi:osmotically-inducible protein OsmY